MPDWRHRGYGSRLRPGGSPLHVAVENGHFELATYLLELGADPDAADPIGYTALHAITRARKVALGDADPPPEGSGNMEQSRVRPRVGSARSKLGRKDARTRHDQSG